MKVYEAVRRYIDANYLKHDSVARAAGIPKQAFRAMMNGKRKMYADELRAICIALGISADTFISREQQISADLSRLHKMNH